MPSFYRANPKVVLEIEGLSRTALDLLERSIQKWIGGTYPFGMRGIGENGCLATTIPLEVDVAEKAVAWLKDRDVEQEPKAPERDTAKAIGRCRRCGETDSRRWNGRCQGVPGSVHDWPEVAVLAS